MPKITFVYPDFESVGIEYLMAVCLRDGHEVNFVYYNAEDTYIGKKKKNISFQTIAKKIIDTQPDIAAFSCVTNNYQFQLSCAKALKKDMPQAITVFGGVHPTAVPEIVLKEPEVDCVAIGEAEESFSFFLKECKFDGIYTLPHRPIKGMVYKRDDNLIGEFKTGELSDLNTLPFPYKNPFYSLLKYFSYEYYIITSRGCPYMCTYCFNSYLHNLRGRNPIRQRSVDNVIAELIWAKKNYSPKYITFLDDSFTTNDKWILEFCKRYKKEINLPFACISIPHYINKEKAEALRKAGCVHVQIGVQSLKKEICNEILHRKSDNGKIAEVINTLRNVGILVQVDHMLGIPEDTLGAQEESILFYNKWRPNIISVFWLTYYPKTSILEIAKQKGILTESDINNINEGKKLNGSLHSGGSMKDPKSFYGIAFLLNYLALFPRWLVYLLVKRRLYNIFNTKNYLISTIFPRTIQSILYRKNFRDRGYLIRFFNKLAFRNKKPSREIQHITKDNTSA